MKMYIHVYTSSINIYFSKFLEILFFFSKCPSRQGLEYNLWTLYRKEQKNKWKVIHITLNCFSCSDSTFFFPFHVTIFGYFLVLFLLYLFSCCSYYCNLNVFLLLKHLGSLQCLVIFLILFLTYILSMSSLECKDLFIVINFLVFWFTCLSPSLDYFKNDPVYSTSALATC